MNFCRFYNRTMNYFSGWEERHIEENPNLPERENVVEINIFLGITNIILSFIVLMVVGSICYLLILGGKLLNYINRKTTSKCDLK